MISIEQLEAEKAKLDKILRDIEMSRVAHEGARQQIEQLILLAKNPNPTEGEKTETEAKPKESKA